MNPQTIKRRKPREMGGIRSKLSPEQAAELLRWLTVEKITYSAAKDRLHARFAIATSTTALHHFFAATPCPASGQQPFEIKVTITTPTGGVQEFVLPVK